MNLVLNSPTHQINCTCYSRGYCRRLSPQNSSIGLRSLPTRVPLLIVAGAQTSRRSKNCRHMRRTTCWGKTRMHAMRTEDAQEVEKPADTKPDWRNEQVSAGDIRNGCSHDEEERAGCAINWWTRRIKRSWSRQGQEKWLSRELARPRTSREVCLGRIMLSLQEQRSQA